MIIPGPDGPGDVIDTYLQPLIEELNDLYMKIMHFLGEGSYLPSLRYTLSLAFQGHCYVSSVFQGHCYVPCKKLTPLLKYDNTI